MDEHLKLQLTGEDDSELAVYEQGDGKVTVVILKKKGSAKFTCQGTDYAAAHHEAFPAPAGTEAAGSKAPETRMTF